MLANLLDSKIKEIGSKYGVQVITDNASNYKADGQILMEKRPTLFWTPCATHCLDLMFENIEKIKEFQSTITNDKRINTFIYRHGRLLYVMREKINGIDLVRARVTRFATSFLSLQSLYKHKDALRRLFICDDWTKSKLSATEAGKKVCETVIANKFWHDVENCIKSFQLLLVVLRIVDGDEKPVMPQIMVAMNVAKKIKDVFYNEPKFYKNVIDTVERRWESQMNQKLYGATLFLNSRKFFDLKEENEIMASCL